MTETATESAVSFLDGFNKPFIHLRPDFDFESARNRIESWTGLETFGVHVVESAQMIVIESFEGDRDEVYRIAEMLSDALLLPLLKRQYVH